MPLQPGTTFGNYEIVDSIGAGGMGEVYRAKDRKLEREVAVKVLPDELARDKERLTRFEREAKLLAQLNHTNIATIHGLEEHGSEQMLVMELVEGETLAERIARGPIPIDEAIPLFTQIAEGLEAAHDKGIIHRDLKPANIMITPEGHVKILDFGLAKALQDDTAPSEDASQSPTVTKGTQLGVILGTASYMSPEQARGKLVDRRTDLWAFGCCLYEALTGRKAFVGETTTDTLAAIVNAEPDWEKLPKATPEWLRHLMRRCLRKNVRDRLTDAGWARVELNDARSPLEATTFDPKPSRSSVYGLAGLALAALTAVVILWIREPPAPEVVKLAVAAPAGSTIDISGDQSGNASSVAISPDGHWIAYVVRSSDGQSQLYLRAIDDFAAEPLVPASSRLMNPRFTSDSEWLGYYDQPNGRIMRVRVEGGRPELVCETGAMLEFDWDTNRGVVFSRALGGLQHCDRETGEVTRLTEPDRDRGDIVHVGAEALPDGSGFIFAVLMRSHEQLAIYRREDNAVRLLDAAGHSPRYVPTGHIVYAQGAELHAIRFDIAELDVIGEPFRVLSGVNAGLQGLSAFGVADNGTLVFVPGDVRVLDEGARKLVWVDREGRKTPLVAPAMGYTNIHINPAATRVAFEVRGGNPDVWTWDLEREALTRVTFADVTDGVPLWSSNESVLFESHRVPQSNVYEKAADGTGDAVRLAESPNHQVPLTISPDGISIIFEERVGPNNNLDLVVFSRDSGVAKPLLATEFNETGAAISPDGRWMAYQSDETGRAEVFVRPFPNVDGGKWPISSTGGSEPTWSRDGDELFFLDHEYRLSVVAIHAGERFNAGQPQRILEESFFNTRLRRSYDVSLDGSRFLVIEDGQDQVLPTEVRVVLHWFSELERLAAAAGI